MIVDVLLDVWVLLCRLVVVDLIVYGYFVDFIFVGNDDIGVVLVGVSLEFLVV